MANWRFEKWCETAVSRIVFPPDRYAVERELRGHLQDRYESELARGATAKEAEEATLAAMGAPEEIALELGLIHRPFWGRFHQLSRWAATGMVCLTLFSLFAWVLLHYVFFQSYSYPVWYRYDPFEDTTYVDDSSSSRRLARGEPLSVSYSDGYLFVLREYALWEDRGSDSLGNAKREDAMYLKMQVVSLVPWAAQTDISRWFSARDDLGNLYSPAYAREGEDYLTSSVYHTGPGVYTHILRFSRYHSREAGYLELVCDRGGRDVHLVVDLKEVAP